MKGVLRFLGKLGKGGATIAGAVLGVGGVAAGSDLLSCFQQIATAPADTLTALGLALLLFGVGRKAGYTATEKK